MYSIVIISKNLLQYLSFFIQYYCIKNCFKILKFKNNNKFLICLVYDALTVINNVMQSEI